MNVLIVSDSQALIDDATRGLTLEGYYHAPKVFMTSRSYLAFLRRGEHPDGETLLVVDTHVDIPIPSEKGGSLRLSLASPSMCLLQETRRRRPRWLRLAIAHEGSVNDGQLSLQAGAHHWHTCGVLGWEAVLDNQVVLIQTALGLPFDRPVRAA